MLHASTGISAAGVVMGTVQFPAAGYPDWPRVDQAFATVVGLFVAQLSRGLLQAVLFQTQVTDIPAAATTGGLLLVAAALACLAPARRAARVAPVEGLKGD